MAKRQFIQTRVRKVPRTTEVPHTPKSDIQRLTLEQGLTHFVRAKESEGIRASTIREYLRHVSYLTDFLVNVKGIQTPLLDDLSPTVIREYITYLLTEKKRYADAEGRKDKATGLAPSTVNIRLRTLKTMCRFWYSEGLAEINAMDGVKPVSTDEQKEVEGLSEAEVELVLNSYDDTQFAEWRDKVLVLLLLDTGIRIQEAIGLTIDRVDFKTATLTVPSQIAKNRKYREVPVSPEVLRMVKDLHDETAQYFGEVEQVFNTAYGEPYTPDSFRKRLNRLKKKIGFQRLSPHQFRHTFARDYLLNGGDLFTLQKILDHADIKTTRKYVQMNAEHVRQQHSRYSPLKKYVRRR